jgi:predicted GNAT superfamily acetyltransferase
MTASTLSAPTAVRAGEEADRAARDAGVRVVEADTPDLLDAVTALAVRVWGPTKTLPIDLLRAVDLAGGTVLVAGPRSGGPPVGFAFGFLGWTGSRHLHSHMTAVLPQWRSSGVGYALKLTQRAVCLAHDVPLMRWTFDPLLLGNARFNLLRLGASPTRFLPDFYGRMDDAINGADVSDRLEVTWRLDRPIGAAPHRHTGPPLVFTDQDGMPQLTGRAPRPGSVLPIPADYPGRRAAGDPRARAWRQVSGEVLRQVYGRGLALAGLGADGYVVGEPREEA